MELTSGLIDNFVISRYFVISDLVVTRVYCIYICLIVVDLEYVATSLCSLLSNTGFFASFPVHLGGKKPRFRLYNITGLVMLTTVATKTLYKNSLGFKTSNVASLIP